MAPTGRVRINAPLASAVRRRLTGAVALKVLVGEASAEPALPETRPSSVSYTHLTLPTNREV